MDSRHRGPWSPQGSPGILGGALSAPNAPLCPLPGEAGSGGRSAGVAPDLCAVPRPDRLDHSPGAALTQPSASAPRTLAASAPLHLRSVACQPSRALPSPKRESIPPKLSIPLSFTLTSHEEVSLESKGSDWWDNDLFLSSHTLK